MYLTFESDQNLKNGEKPRIILEKETERLTLSDTPGENVHCTNILRKNYIRLHMHQVDKSFDIENYENPIWT